MSPAEQCRRKHQAPGFCSVHMEVERSPDVAILLSSFKPRKQYFHRAGMKKEIPYYPQKGSLSTPPCRQERGQGHQAWSQQKPSHPTGGHGCCRSWCQDFHWHRRGCAVSHTTVVHGGSPLFGKGSCKGPHGHRQEVGSRRMLLFSWVTFARAQDQALDLEEDEHVPLCSSPASSPIPFLPHMAAGTGGTRCQPPSQLLPLAGTARSWPQPCALGQQGAPPSTSLCWPARLPPLHGVTSRFSNQLVCT